MASPSTLVSFDALGVNRRTLNGNLRGARNTTMLSLIGSPRGSYNQSCQNPTNARIAALMATESIGPFRATGMKVALASVRAIMAEIKTDHREVYDAMSSAGMLCCRNVRGSSTAISNHSWGSAIDIKLEGKLDKRGNNKTQTGLFDIFPIFNKHKWFWGAAFRTEDAMHFEASDQLIREWAVAGEFGAQPARVESSLVTLGDRGPEVEELQHRLNFAVVLDITADGVFGRETRAAVMEFQRQAGLTVDGVVGPKTKKALEAATSGHSF